MGRAKLGRKSKHLSMSDTGHETASASWEDASAERDLPLRLKSPPGPATATVDIHPLPSHEGIIVKVSPPESPTRLKADHVPCDIVLVIDISGSMGVDAPVPTKPGEVEERNGLSVLDLVKHASLTIVESLNENDRLGIVTFSSSAKVLQKLIPMDADNKKFMGAVIDCMKEEDQTNLWHGLMEGVKLFGDGANTGRVPAIMLLTDGCPNHMEPPQGYIPKLRTKAPLPATLHTFGFGYTLRSGLLKSLAEFGNGNYSFIPDAGMLGTVFVHAVANLQSTFATAASVTLDYAPSIKFEQTMGDGVDVKPPTRNDQGRMELTVSLGNLQYGQSRDLFFRYAERPSFAPEKPVKIEHDDDDEDAVDTDMEESEFLVVDREPELDESSLNVIACLTYQHMSPQLHHATASRSLLEPTTTLSEAEAAYHVSRAAIVSFIADLFPLRWDVEHEALPYDGAIARRLQDELLPRLPAARFSDPLNASLMSDLHGDAPHGQVGLALSRKEFYDRWGVHYLPSLAGAHARQVCNSFKDPGPLRYGAGSALFAACRDKLDQLFDTLPAPRPSNLGNPYAEQFAYGAPPAGYSYGAALSNMHSYHRSDNPCFAGFCPVALPGGRFAPVERLRRGAEVMTPRGPRTVAAVLKTRVTRTSMSIVGGLVVTPWHPVRREGSADWAFPRSVAKGRIRYSGSIYSVLLQPDADPEAHAVLVGGVWGVTLGHGLVQGADVRVHRFLGDYSAVAEALARIDVGRNGIRRNGLVLGGGVVRDVKLGRVSGFKAAQPGQRRWADRMDKDRDQAG